MPWLCSLTCWLLLPIHRNEETAFWLLVALVEDILQPDTYNSNLVGCQVGGGQIQPFVCV